MSSRGDEPATPTRGERRALAGLAALVLALAAFTEEAPPPLARGVVGGAHVYEALPGDSLTSVAARFGVDVPVLAHQNGLAPTATLALGQAIAIENPHLVPAITELPPPPATLIVVNVPQRMLFWFRAGELAGAFPVAVGRPTWRTPLGSFEIDERAMDKAWIVPVSIQEEMRREGNPVLTTVPPGPNNPLGRHWLGLAPSSCGIHGTIAPTSIYGLRTHGCIRLHPDDAAQLYEAARVGDAVRIAYEPLLLAELPDGRVCLEAHRDAYGRAPDARAWLQAALAAHELEGRTDLNAAGAVLDAREGIARDVTMDGRGGSCL